MRVAALDLGSNTSLLLIAEVENGRLVKVLRDENNVTRMGQEVHARRRFHPDALARMEACLAQYGEFIRAAQCDKVIAVATSAARDVANGAELIDIGKRHGIPIHIISGPREAELTYRGALCDRSSTEHLAVVDVGGGSTEVIGAYEGSPRGISIDVGSVRLTEMFLPDHPVGAEALKALGQHIEKSFAGAQLDRLEITEVVAVAGTPTTLAALELGRPFSEEHVHRFRLELATIERWIQHLARLGVAERERLPGMQPKRADVIVAGAMILAGAMRALRKEAITVSTLGVRYGVALACKEF